MAQITIEQAERAAIAWSQMSDEGTMHLRALRNLMLKKAGLPPLDDNEPLDTNTSEHGTDHHHDQ